MQEVYCQNNVYNSGDKIWSKAEINTLTEKIEYDYLFSRRMQKETPSTSFKINETPVPIVYVYA